MTYEDVCNEMRLAAFLVSSVTRSPHEPTYLWPHDDLSN